MVIYALQAWLQRGRKSQENDSLLMDLSADLLLRILQFLSTKRSFEALGAGKLKISYQH